MNWNPFNRIAALERELAGLRLSHNRLIERFDQLELTVQAQGTEHARRLNNLAFDAVDRDSRLTSLQKQIGAPVLTISRADVEKEAKARLKRAAYSRKYYANKRAEKAKAAAAGEAK